MTAIAECRKLGIPVVSILDTNCDPDLVDIPIPGNDDAVRSIKLILNSLTDSIINGQSKVN
jgi:small subunit ribosomal protein S2